MRNKRKNVVVWLYALCMMVAASWGILASSVVVEAAERKTDGTYYYKVLENGKVEITGYPGYTDKPTALVIPATIAGKTVTSIGDYTFYNCRRLTSLSIPKSVTKIGHCLFEGCSGLTNLSVASGNPTYYSEGNCIIRKSDKVLVAGCQKSKIPNNVKRIGDYAFYYCSGLTSISIPKSVKSIGDSAFTCSGLKSVKISNGVKSIGGGAFSGCNGLKNISIPKSVKSIGKSAFYGCSEESITIASGVKSIGEYAFAYNKKLKKVTIGKNVTSIGEGAFENCMKLTQMTLKTSKLTESSVGENALKKTNKKLVIKVPKQNVLTYQTYFENKGNKRVTITE